VSEKKMVIKLFTALLIMATPFYAWAAPNVSSISGTVTHGQTIAISGSNFGAHANFSNGGTWKGQTFLNRGFKDFEDGQINSNQFSTDGAQNWSVDPTGNRTNSAYNGKKYYGVSRLGALSIYAETGHTEWFASFWFKMDPGSSSGKPMRIWSGTQGNDVTLFAGGGDSLLRGTDGLVTEWGGGNLVFGTWQRIDFYMRDVASNDRGVTTWINGSEAWSHVNESGHWPPSYPYNDGGHTWDFGDLYDGPSGAYHFDDIYVSHTRARVEIGNASTWASSTHREIQIPKNWSSSSITIAVNVGSFATGTTAYLYVVDSSGNVNTQGYPIVIGGGGGSAPPPSTAPNPPSGLTISN
jgi:hypothetical protein